MQAQAISLSAVIIAFNEEKNIARCLDSLCGIADEIVVVNSYSTDNTGAIALSKGARVIEQEFLGYAEQKNFATSQASSNYILSLDADEALSDKLRASITFAKAHWQHDGYSMSRLTNYCGSWIRHGGWYPDKKVRLFDRRLARWRGERLHEGIEIDAKRCGELAGDLLHYSFYTISDHLKVIDKYTEIQAQELYDKGARAGLSHLLIRPAFKFFRDYIIKAGFLDGFSGYCVAKLSAKATFVKYAKLKMLCDASKSDAIAS
jgi:glycosyltransferase involved in cell wall biosynthesis